MSRIWSSEYSSILVAIGALVMLGLLTGNWLISSLVILCGYILWLYRRMARLEKWVSKGTKVSQVYDDDGFVGIIIRHLYQQKKSYNQRKKRTKAILATLNRNISALPDATVLLNAELEIKWCNAPARYLLAIRSPQDLGYRISNLIRDPDFLTYLNNIESREYIEIGAPGDPQVTVQLRIVALGADQMLLIARNVSDQKQLQEGLKNFVANASHELKSPLTVIAGQLEMIEDEPGLSQSARESVASAQRQAGRMQQLIQDLLLLSQVESYQLRPDEGQKVPVADIMASATIAMVSYEGRERIAWDYPDNLLLLGVKAELEGICINLIENALNYATPGTPIRVSWEVNPLGEFQFSVSDQGPGIPAAHLGRITERYYRGARSAATVAGSGLGLAIVQQAAHKHGALLEIDSKPGSGSTFRVIFPSYRCLQGSLPTARVFQISDY
jgi:two-component system, OmpR family, phosphate regulon sensor histidine kinase PhoR